MRRIAPIAVALVLGLGALTACGDDEPAPSGSDQDPVTIEITFDGDTVTPSGDRVDVEVGQPIELVVKADAGGEIHVHFAFDQAGLTGSAHAPLAGKRQVGAVLQPGVEDVLPVRSQLEAMLPAA